MPSNRCVFIVDDDPSVRISMKRLLRAYGFSSLLFESATALLDYGEFDGAICAILDVNLKDRSGIELRRHLTHEGVALPVIYITGNDSPASRSAAMESGCVAYLTKPFAADVLIQAIDVASAGIS